ncbi:hypothetical protein ACFQVC_32550 [Streptomyces monticola]|uniref:Transcriptional regulator n=1 Tax=Streptomyces monticola TaxID=2666263 RepID=A0ABW2JT26_9ACTN
MSRQHRPNRQLAALLAEADWSAGDLARAVNTLGNAQGLALRYDRTAVAHWLTGTRPRPPVPDLMAAAFTERLSRLITPADLTPDARSLRTPTPLAPTALGEAATVRHLSVLCRQDTDPARRAFLAQTGYTLIALPLVAWNPPAPGRTSKQPALGQVHASDVQALQEMAGFFASLRQRYGGGHARTTLAEYIADDAAPLLTAPAPHRLRGEVLTGAAQLVYLLAEMSADDGLPGPAQRYFHLALSLARHAGNRRQYAITLRATAAQAGQLGHHTYSHQLADTALDAAGPHADGAVRSFLLTERALTHAQQGQRGHAIQDLTAAEHHHDRSTSPTGPFATYPEAGLHYQRAQVLAALGEHTETLTALRGSLRARPSQEHRPVAVTHAQLAEHLLHIGHIEAACPHAHRFLDHYPHLHSALADQALSRLTARLKPHRKYRYASAVLNRARTLASPRSAT